MLEMIMLVMMLEMLMLVMMLEMLMLIVKLLLLKMMIKCMPNIMRVGFLLSKLKVNLINMTVYNCEKPDHSNLD